ncbi:hypothetical protein LPB136_06585 [Tenacibaculum todarodis]|uniref:Polysaccharide biosynthesis protein C-terminal domain-containing protein n=1 Tax=Tenacibaculum todarodis TaxID=1850252 RepID=A0A1L3JIV3_9FLAO|nr:oligosaccharide flippase family protein [Tenacibaculum todarodis]APG65044.1 hypothetical protein LPB136_06585 [Tenacibaculum todarodis]
MKKALISVTFFNFFAAGITFLINIILARLFPIAVFGRINLLLSLSAIFIIFFQFGFNNSMVVFYNKNKQDEADFDLLNYITKRYRNFLCFSIPILVLLFIVIDKYYQFSFWEILFLLSSTLFIAIYRFFSTYYQALGKWNKYNFLNVAINVLKGAVLVLGAIIMIYLFKNELNYEMYLKLYVLYGILLLFIGIIASHKIIGFKNKKTYNNKEFNGVLMSLGFTNIVIALTMRLDNVIIENFVGVEAVAIYSAANTLALIFPLITGSIMRVLMKEISRDSNYYLTKILKFQKKYFLHLIVLIGLIILVSPYLIELFFGERFRDSIRIFQILITVYVGGIFFTPLEAYFYNEQPKRIFTVKLIQFLLFFVMAIIMVQYYSIIGVALAVVFCRLIIWSYLYFLSRKRLKKVKI